MSDTGFARLVVRVEDTDPSIFTFTNDDGTRLDLTGMTFRFAVEWEGGSLLLISGVAAELVVLDQTVAATKGQLSLNLSTAQRAGLPVDGRQIRFNLQRVNGPLKISRPYGEVIAERWVTNA